MHIQLTKHEIHQKQTANLLRARFPFLYFTTWEEDRAKAYITSIAQNETLIKTKRKVFSWTLTEGFSNGELPLRETQQPLKALEFIEKFEEPSIFILKDFHIYFGNDGRQPDYTIIRKLRDLNNHLKNCASPKNIIFISPIQLLPKELEKDITLVDFELPDIHDIRTSLNHLIETNQYNERISISLTEQEKDRLVHAALGLTLAEAENAFARAIVDDGVLNVSDVETVLKEKEQIIKKTGILEFFTSSIEMDEIGGLENLKRWLTKRNNAWLDSAQAYGIPFPKGVLISGVPGCGKSLISKAISSKWQLPLLRFDISKIFDGLVGGSEENMRQVLKTAEAIAPCILWIDEIEKGFSGINNSGDGGTATRVFGQFLTWMQEKEKPVFVIATANNISALPPEMMRKGRFDEIFFVDMPTERERIEIFKVHLQKRLTAPQAKGDFVIDDHVLLKLAQLSEGFVGAEIEQVVINGMFEAFSENRAVQFSDFQKIAEQIVPLSVTQAEHIKALREWANVRAVAATPQVDRQGYMNQQQEPIVKGPTDIDQERGGRTIDF